MAFLNYAPVRPARFFPNPSATSLSRPLLFAARARACATPQQAVDTSSEHNELDDAQPFLLPDSTIASIVQGTMLHDCQLASVYSSDVQGFSNESFFDAQMPLEGVPSLLLGQTETGVFFGGYTAFGFIARDDYREATNEKAMFVFSVRADDVLFAFPTDLVLYDFYDYAVRFGSALLCIPMNPAKHIMRANAASSTCRMPDGTTSVFGDFGMAKLKKVQVLVAKKYLDELQRKTTQSTKGFFSRLFG
ncbi:unnamed protein product [Agarophyton chilense]